MTLGCTLILAALPLAEVRPDRPRIFITADGVAVLRAKCRGSGKALYEAMKRRADGMLRSRARLDNQGRFYLPTYAFLYLVTGEARYAERAEAWLELLAQETIEDSWTCLEYVPVASAAYDWLHGRLTREQRARYAGGLIRQVERLKRLWRHSDYNNHFLLEHMSELYVALAIAGEAHHREIGRAWLREAEGWLKRHVIPASNEMAGGDGGHAEGFSYANWGYERPLARLVMAWRTATGEDLFPRAEMLRTLAAWNVYGRLPDGRMFRSEDCPTGHRWSQGAKGTFAVCAAAYRDGLAQWAHDRIEARYPQAIWFHLLAWDPSVRAAPPDPLPLARIFRGIGHVYTRSGWGPDATWASFQCGPIFAGHQHLDNNAFTIFHKGRLAIDSGTNEYSSHRANYYSRTIAHNTITVLDPDETFPSAVWSAEGTGGSNDGGGRRIRFPTRATATAKEKAARDVGRIIAFHQEPAFCYAAGDATRSYSPRKVRSFTRQFLHIRPGTFVVFDRVVSTRAAFAKTWLLHAIPEPRIEGRRIEIASREGGRLVVFSLLPEKAEIRKIGGPGKRFQVGARNWPPDGRVDPGSGDWRVEVSPAASAESDLFLHVLWAGDRDGPAPPAVRMRREGDRVTVQVGEGAAQVAASFATRGPVRAWITPAPGQAPREIGHGVALPRRTGAPAEAIFRSPGRSPRSTRKKPNSSIERLPEPLSSESHAT